MAVAGWCWGSGFEKKLLEGGAPSQMAARSAQRKG